MLDYTTIELQQVAVHRVGNKNRAERNFISKSTLPIDETLEVALMEYFLKPIKKATDWYRFQHTSDVNLNEVYNYAKSVFENPDYLLNASEHIVNHLYRQSEHPNIKSGEVYVVYFDQLVVEDEMVSALGIFKSERKHHFLKIDASGDSLMINTLEGIAIEKLDKGCLIVNMEAADGYRVLSVDNNAYDAMYWPHHFLGIDYVEDSNFHTKLYLEMCQEFSKEVIASNADKREQIQFLADSVDYFAHNEVFDFNEFTEKVLPDEKLKTEFQSYQNDFALQEVDGFDISPTALKTAKRAIKSVIKLDTNISIRLNVNQPESSQQFLEKAYDEARGMYYYKVYFNEEL